MKKSIRTYYFLPGETSTRHTDGTDIDHAYVVANFDELCLVDPVNPDQDKANIEKSFLEAGYAQFSVRVFTQAATTRGGSEPDYGAQ